MQKEVRYWDYMHKGYLYTRDTIDVTGLYNPEDAFWWRDKNWNSQDSYVNGKPVYWSRGNGWVYAALVRVMNELPETSPYHAFYKADFLAMSASLLACQREDGFWNPDLINDQHYGGKETSGQEVATQHVPAGQHKVTLPARKGLFVVTVISNNGSKLGQIKGLSF